jgi:hypothetical protein
MCNVTLSRLHETTVAVKNCRYYIFLCVCVCVCARSLAIGWGHAYACMRLCVCVCVGAPTRACACARVRLFIQYATLRLHIFCVLKASPCFSTLSNKRHDFRKKVTEHKMCVLIFSTHFIWNFSHSKENSARYCHKCEKFSCKYPLFLSDFNKAWIFSTDFLKSLRCLNFIKTRPVGV